MKSIYKKLLTIGMVLLLSLMVYASTVITDNGSTFGGNITTTGNVSADYFVGDGSLLTGIASGGDSWSDAVDSNIIPVSQGTYDIGSTTKRMKGLYLDRVYAYNGIERLFDADTSIIMSTDKFTFYAGGVNFMQMIEDSTDVLSFNDFNVDMDFVVNGDTNDAVLKVDAGTESVEILNYIDYKETDGNISVYSNGCYQKVNSTGIYTIC